MLIRELGKARFKAKTGVECNVCRIQQSSQNVIFNFLNAFTYLYSLDDL